MGDILLNPISALDLDDTEFLKLSEAEDRLSAVKSAMVKLATIREAVKVNQEAFNYDDSAKLLVEITIRVQPHTAINLVADGALDLAEMMDAAKKELEAL
jgi:uncharacterized radical SAM superfamily protein